mgnify:CR=1 FL=1
MSSDLLFLAITLVHQIITFILFKLKRSWVRYCILTFLDALVVISFISYYSYRLYQIHHRFPFPGSEGGPHGGNASVGHPKIVKRFNAVRENQSSVFKEERVFRHALFLRGMRFPCKNCELLFRNATGRIP